MLMKRRELRKSEMTSMIDMIFLLLIFFLVTLSVKSSPVDDEPRPEIDRPTVSNSINDTIFTLKIAIKKNDSEDTLNKQYKVYVLDSTFNSMSVVDILVQKKYNESVAFTKQGIDKYKDSVEYYGNYLPMYLPSSDLYFNSIDSFEVRYAKVFDHIKSHILKKIDKYNELFKYHGINKRIKLFCDLDKDMYYKFIVDLNNLYYDLYPNKQFGILQRDDNIFYVVNQPE